MRIRLCACLILACGVAATQEKPEVVKKGTVACDLVEATPIVWKARLYRFEYVRDRYKHNALGKPYFRFVDYETGEATPPFAEGYHLGSAFAEDGVMYVYGVREWGEGVVRAFWSKDLKEWQAQDALKLPPGWTIFNNSVCKDDKGYVMAIEIGDPPEVVGHRFTLFFARSENLLDWKLEPLECVFTRERYSACPTIRFLDGWYYMVYLERLEQWYFAPQWVRSKDLRDWVLSPLNPMMKPGPEDKQIANTELTGEERARIDGAENINNSDVDFCEFDGKTVISYSWGNQRGVEFLAEAVYRGPEAAFLRGWFPQTEDR